MDCIILDIETTGVPEKREGELDFAAVFPLEVCALRPGKWRICQVLRPPAGTKIHPKARETNGITDEDLAGGADPAAFLQMLANRLADVSEPRAIVGHNLLGFDLPVLAALAAALGVSWPRLSAVDTMLAWRAYAMGRRRWPGESVEHFWGRVSAERYEGRSNLAFLCRHYQTEHAPRHRADQDVEATWELFYRMAYRTPSLLVEVLGEDWREALLRPAEVLFLRQPNQPEPDTETPATC